MEDKIFYFEELKKENTEQTFKIALHEIDSKVKRQGLLLALEIADTAVDAPPLVFASENTSAR